MVDVRTGIIGRTLPSEKQGVHTNNLGPVRRAVFRNNPSAAARWAG
jgi:hypothetical protein